jgi:hypothetical protein
MNTYGTPISINNGLPELLEQIKLDGSDYNEDYIRNLAFDHPSCLPISDIDGAYKGAVSICKELRTPVGPLDALMVNPDGRLIIVEAKLWRNPQARREVVAQVLDYAKELSRWDYEDLQRAVSANLGKKGNALYEMVKAIEPDLEESAFVDAVSRSLKEGRFLLLILGDGIREGAGSLTSFIERVGNLEFTFGLVEMGLYRSASTGTIFVQPRVLVRSEIVRRSIVRIKDGVVDIEEESGELDEPIELNEREQWYLNFWKEFKAELTLDDPEQPTPEPNYSGNFYFAMPPSGSQVWVSAYFFQNKNQTGIYLRLKKGNLAERLSAALLDDAEAIQAELGSEAVIGEDKHGNLTISTVRQFTDLRSPVNRSEIKQFLLETANVYVNTFRQRLARLVEDSAV